MDNQIKKQAKEVFNAMNNRDFDTFEQIITEDVALEFPGVSRAEGKRRTLLLMKSILRKYPVLKFTVSEIISEAERACVVWTNQGEDSKGNPYANSGMTLIHFTEGKISFISDYFKDTSFTNP